MKFLSLLILVGLTLVAQSLRAEDGNVLWRIGAEDGSSAEFTGDSVPSTFTIPIDWATRTTWPEWSGIADKTHNWTSDITYTMNRVPKGGALFKFKTVKASPYVPELAVFSNGYPCGILQTVGANYPGIGPKPPNDRRFARECQVYIPCEFLVAGQNVLRVQRLGHPYRRDRYLFLDFTIDYLRLDALDVVPNDPIHSHRVYIGYSEGEFDMNPQTIATAQAGHEWMGVAYSNNPERTGFFQDIAARQNPDDQLAYLQKLKDLNMAVIMDGWNIKNTKETQIIDGKLPDDAASYIDNLLRRYGKLAEYYEICNEPCMRITNASYEYCLAVAKHIAEVKPPSLNLMPPGYTFGGGSGDPKNWDDVKGRDRRRTIDSYCSVLSGHSFAQSYCNTTGGGSFIETVDTYGKMSADNVAEVPNGFDKPFVTTEMGSATCHWDFNEIPQNRYASIQDRNIRAHIGFADVFCAADLWNNGQMYDYLVGDTKDPSTWTANPCSDGKDSRGGPDTENRVKVLRRLTLAYATHGRPLPYIYTQLAAVRNQLVYFRAVDTSTLPPLPGSGATSNKILLSFVNFDEANPHSVAVRVTLPASCIYHTVRYGPEPSYTAARSELQLEAKPNLDLTVDLKPGESVEYILDKQGASK